MASKFTKARTLTGAGLSAAAVLCGAVTGMTAHAATGQTAAVPQNGPLYFHTIVPQNWGGALYAVNQDGTGRHEVPITGTGYDAKTSQVGDLELSPDGSKLVFDSQDGRIWESDADGTGTHPLTAAPPVDPQTNRQQYTDQQPTWSPDGRSVYFSRVNTILQPGAAEAAFEVVPADGGPGQDKPFQGLTGTHLSVAANGTMVYTETMADNGKTIVVVGDSGGHDLGSFPGIDAATAPTISPDGSQLVVVLTSGPAPSGGVAPTDVFVATAANGWKPVQVTHFGDVTPWIQPTWSPDGTQIAYTRGNTDRPITGNADPMQLDTQAPVATATAHTTLTDAIGTVSWQNVPGTGTTPPPAGLPVAIREGGADRVATAVAVADAAYGPHGTVGKAKVAVLSRDDDFADALAGNALAAQKGGPLLLTGKTGLDPRVAAELGRILAPGATVYVLGGTEALSPKIESDLTALHLSVKRLSGPTRFDTAVAVAGAISAHPHTVMVATGMNAPDALAAGAAAAQDPAGGVVLLSQDGTLPAATKAYLADVNPATTKVYGVGGQGVAAVATMPAIAAHATALKGSDRYQTDIAVASETALFPNPAAIGLATGRTWPDALAGGAFIATQHGPLLLTDGPNVPAETTAWVATHAAHLTGLTVFGGENAVPYTAARSVAVTAWGPTAWVNKLINLP